MSLLAVQGGATGTGTVTLLAPVTNTDRTLTLPDVTDTVAGIAATQTLTNKTLTTPVISSITNTGTLTLPTSTDTLVGRATTDTLTNKTLTTPNIDSAQFATVSGTAPIYPCRAWVNFNGSGTVAIRDDGNVSSITDNGTGDYTVNFTTAMPDVNYAMLGTGRRPVSTPDAIDCYNRTTSPTTAAVRIATTNGAGTNEDFDIVAVAIFR